MQSLVRIIFVGATVLLAACWEPIANPRDIRDQTLDAKEAIPEADTIVLASVINERDIRRVLFPVQDKPKPVKLRETQTTLRTLQVLKGPALPPEIRFRYYDAPGYILVGPPQGPSGGVGSRGIFFLKGRPEGIYRPVVDIYRPDIATPWLAGSPDPEPCSKAPSDCIAELLLTYHKSDDDRSFSAHLPMNVAISRRLTGFFKTYELLDGLAGNEAHPDSVRREACVEMSGWYPLEVSSLCSSLLAGTAAAEKYPAVAAREREGLKKRGLVWVQQEIGTTNEDEVKRYLELLMKVPDEETRKIARGLSRKVQ
jgi:hypothetical protein